VLRSITRCIANYGRVVKFRSFLSYRKLCRISLVAVFFASNTGDIALLPGGIKLEQFLLLFRALVFLIQPRNEYPLVNFIAATRWRIPRVDTGYRWWSSASPTFSLKKIIRKANQRYLRLWGIVLSPKTGYKHPSKTNSYEREGRCELPTLLSGLLHKTAWCNNILSSQTIPAHPVLCFWTSSL